MVSAVVSSRHIQPDISFLKLIIGSVILVSTEHLWCVKLKLINQPYTFESVESVNKIIGACVTVI
jgi:hypothetical protein